jgi:hypothetical protein
MIFDYASGIYTLVGVHSVCGFWRWGRLSKPLGCILEAPREGPRAINVVECSRMAELKVLSISISGMEMSWHGTSYRWRNVAMTDRRGLFKSIAYR